MPFGVGVLIYKKIIIGVKCKPSGDKDITGILEEGFTDVSIYKQLIMDNVEPEIKFDYIPFDYNGNLIGILKIYGSNMEKPYMIKKQNQGLHIGQCYIRKGANNTNAIRNDFNIFYKMKERFEIKLMDKFFSAAYTKEGCARITVTMRNYTKLPVVIICGELLVCNYDGQTLSKHPVYGFEEKIVGADFKLSFMPMEEKCGELYVGFSSTDCLRLGINEDGYIDERFIFYLKLYDTNENEYEDKIEDGFVHVRGDFLWKVQLKSKEGRNNKLFSRFKKDGF